MPSFSTNIIDIHDQERSIGVDFTFRKGLERDPLEYEIERIEDEDTGNLMPVAEIPSLEFQGICERCYERAQEEMDEMPNR